MVTTYPLADYLKAIFGSSFRWVRGFSVYHHGIDLSAATGTPVKNVTSGTVIWAGFAGGGGAGYATPYKAPDTNAPSYAIGGGNTVLVRTADGVVTTYAHLNNIAVTQGQTVYAGSVLGGVGQTGNATGPHLHFGVWDPNNRKYIDPLPYLQAPHIQLVSATTPGMTCAGDIGPCFPTNHVITDADIHYMVDTWAAKWPSQFGSVEQAAALDVLRPFIGKQWNDATIKEISVALLEGSKNSQGLVLQVAGEAISNTAGSIGGFAMDIVFKVAAIGLGGIFIVIGAKMIAEKAGT